MKKIFSFVFLSLSIFILNFICVKGYEEYKIGDLVRYNNIAFYVIEDSDSSVDSVQLLKMVPLSREEINKYTDNKALFKIVDGIDVYEQSDSNYAYGNMAFYYSSDCNENITDGCISDYNVSKVKSVVDLWTNENFDDNDIVMLDDGYKSRVLNGSEIVGIDPRNKPPFSQYAFNLIGPKWLTLLNNYSWTMEKYSMYVNGGYYIDYLVVQTIPDRYSYWNGSYVYESGSVRPTIKLKKNSLTKVEINGNEYHNNEKREYKIGDIINYNDTKFYVIKNSSANDDTVTLLKDNPLTEYEIKKYGEGHINKRVSNIQAGEVINEGGKAKVAYYTSNDCYDLGIVDVNNGNVITDENYTGCSPNYDTSDIKYIVDNWSLDNINSSDISKDSFGYKARLINKDDLFDLGYYSEHIATMGKGERYKYGNDTPQFLLNDNTSGMFTMIISSYYPKPQDATKNSGISLSDNGYEFIPEAIPYNTIGTVRPVVTLNKKEIEKKITNVEEIDDKNVEVNIETEVDNSNIDVSSQVKVPNTLSSKKNVVIIIGISLIIISFFIYYIKRRK